jgi:S-(hydroxymethyl)glutathione dehydrogenase/alcohol dehydrogenase
MKAAILVEQRQPLEVAEIELPPDLEVGQVLVKIHYTGICGSQLGRLMEPRDQTGFYPTCWVMRARGR